MKKSSVAVFFDTSKAYDCVWVQGLIFKLANIEISGKYRSKLIRFTNLKKIPSKSKSRQIIIFTALPSVGQKFQACHQEFSGDPPPPLLFKRTASLPHGSPASCRAGYTAHTHAHKTTDPFSYLDRYKSIECIIWLDYIVFLSFRLCLLRPVGFCSRSACHPPYPQATQPWPPFSLFHPGLPPIWPIRLCTATGSFSIFWDHCNPCQ